MNKMAHATYYLRRAICLTGAFFYLSLLCFGQKSIPDSLYQIYRNHPKDTIGLSALNTLALNHLANTDPDSAEVLFRRIAQVSRQIRWPRGTWLYYKGTGFIFNRRGQLRTSLVYYDSAVVFGRANHISNGPIYGNMGGAYQRLQQYDSALIYLHLALEEAIKTPDKVFESRVYSLFATTYGNMGDEKNSIKYGLACYRLAYDNGDTDMAMRALDGICNNFAYSKDEQNRLIYTEKMLHLAASSNNKYHQYLAYFQYAAYFEGLEQYQDALTWLDKCQPLITPKYNKIDRINFASKVANCYSNLGQKEQAVAAWATFKNTANPAEVSLESVNMYSGLGVAYMLAGTTDSADYFIDKAVKTALAFGSPFAIQRAYKIKTEHETRTNRIDHAIQSFQKYRFWNDSLQNADKVREMTTLELNFNFERERNQKDRSILLLQNQNLAAELKIKAQTDAIFRNKTEAEKREILLQLLSRDNAIQSLSIRQKDDSLSTQQLRFELQQAEKNQQLATLRAQQTLDNNRRNWAIGILIALLTLSGLVFYIFRIRQKANHAQQVAEVEMRALRAQMNPHFLFNSMNTVNAYILRNDPHTASAYLSRFARVMRNILENSQHPTITLEKEIELLTAYLEVEQKRIEKGLQYEIKVDEDVDTFDTRVPSMILQPFIENAILHGIQPKKEGPGTLRVHISTAQDQHIRCLIEDNGVGRPMGAANNTHTSMGLKITTDRLNLWHRHQVTQPIQFTDLKNDYGQAMGTRVEIII